MLLLLVGCFVAPYLLQIDTFALMFLVSRALDLRYLVEVCVCVCVCECLCVCVCVVCVSDGGKRQGKTREHFANRRCDPRAF